MARQRVAGQTRVRELVDPAVAEAGYDLEAFSVRRVGRRHIVSIAVDADGGVDLDGVALLSRRISKALDAAEAAGETLFPGEYELEVGSPGIDRQLAMPRHWRRNVGRLVSVKIGSRTVTARVVAAAERGVTLDLDGVSQNVDYADLGPGRVQVEFARAGESLDDADEMVSVEGDDVLSVEGEPAPVTGARITGVQAGAADVDGVAGVGCGIDDAGEDEE